MKAGLLTVVLSVVPYEGPLILVIGPRRSKQPVAHSTRDG